MVEPGSDWTQNPNYQADTMGQVFSRTMAIRNFVGPARPVSSQTFLVGFLVLGPETLYPDHSHRAAKVYHVIAGSAEWWRDGEEWITRPPGG